MLHAGSASPEDPLDENQDQRRQPRSQCRGDHALKFASALRKVKILIFNDLFMV